jgi:hypothetical protein
MKQTLFALAGVILLVAGTPAPALAQAPAAAPAAAAPRPKLISPVRGLAQIDYVTPASKRSGNKVITTIRVKNKMTAPIAGLKVDEFWYNTGGDPVGGGTARLAKPLMPGEVAEIQITFNSVPDMNRNSYKFTHANGEIKTTQVKKIDLPKAGT